MKKEIKAYFSSYDKTSTVKALDTNESKKYNTKLSFDDYSIDFVSYGGEKTNLKFKNKIEGVYAICDGIIIKFEFNSENLDFFFKPGNSSHYNTGRGKSYFYYIITNHPLNNYSSLINLSNDNIKNLNILKTSIKYPFVIAANGKKIEIFLLQIRKNNALEDFNSRLKRIINSDEAYNTDCNFSDYKSENSYSLMLLSEYNLNKDYISVGSEEIKIYSNFTQKNSVFFTFFFRDLKILTVIELKFKTNDLFSFVKNVFSFSHVNCFKIINSVLAEFDEEEPFERKKNKINKNLIIQFLKKKKLYLIKNKSLCFLDEDGYLNFVEETTVVLRLNIMEVIRYKTKSNLKKDRCEFVEFRLDKKTFYSFTILERIENKIETHEIGTHIKIGIEDEFVLNFLKFFKINFQKEVFYSFLQKILELFAGKSCCSSSSIHTFDELSIFLEFILFLFGLSTEKKSYYTIESSTEDDMSDYMNEFFPIMKDFINENKIKYLEEYPEGSYQNNDILFKENLPQNILIYFTENRKNLIYNLADFSKNLYENSKIRNFNSTKIDTLPNFILSLLSMLENTNKSMFTRYVIFFNSNYQLEISKNIRRLLNENLRHLDMFKADENEKDFELKSFLTYLSSISCQNAFTPLKSFQFSFLDKINSIFCKINNIYDEGNLFIENNIFLTNEYNLFLRNINEDYHGHHNKNVLVAIINAGLDIHSIKQMHPFVSMVLLQEISKYKSNPFVVLTNDKNLCSKILKLIDRLDIAKNYKADQFLDNSQAVDTNDNISGFLYDNHSSNYTSDYFITNIKFNQDTRFKECQRILNPHRIIKVKTNDLMANTDSSKLEIEKFNLMLKSLIRQYSSAIGYGTVNLNTIKTFPKDILNIKYLNLQCISSYDESTFKLDINSENLKDKDFVKWPEFHNGVSQALKLSTEYFTNKSSIRNWILFNKPNTASYEHGGFLLGLGLLKQLDSLYSTDIYQYMKTAHDGITIGILLGRAASKISSMEESLSRTLCLHIAYLIPSSLEINIPMNIQCAASIGLGLLYMDTGNRLMTEMLLNQIGRRFYNEKSNNISHVESYNLCLGFSIGLINLGKGTVKINEDLKLEEKLINLANGGKKLDFSSNKFKGDQIKKSTGNFFEETEVNIKLSAPAAYACLSLIYVQSNNAALANKILIPANLFQLSSFKPFNIYLAILTKNLIMWDDITATEEWIYNQIPDYIKFLYEEKLSTISENISYTSIINNIEFSQIATSYFYSISAAVSTIGYKNGGTNKKEVSDLIQKIIQKLRKVKIVSDIIVKEYNKFNDINKFYLNKNTLEQCLCICAYSLAIVMAGSGDLVCFKLLRVIRKRLDSDVSSFHYGYNQAIHHSIGILFSGAGALTFSQSKETFAFIYISIFPIFASSTNCNERYLQALRHFYVLACDNKILETRDVYTGASIRTKMDLVYNDNRVESIITPVNVSNLSDIKYFSVLSDDFYHLNLQKEDFLQFNSNSNMTAKTIYLKKKCDYYKDISKSIQLMPFDSKENYSLINSIVNNCVEKLRKIVKKESEKEEDQDANLFSSFSILIDQCGLINNNNNEYQMKIKKNSLILFINFIQKDKIQNFLVLNDYLLKLIKILNEGKIDWEIFNIFSSLSAMNEDSKHVKCVYNEIESMIVSYLKMIFQEKFKIFLKKLLNYSDVENISTCDLIEIVSFFKFFGIEVENFDMNTGFITILIKRIINYMKAAKLTISYLRGLISYTFSIDTNSNKMPIKTFYSNHNEIMQFIFDSLSALTSNCLKVRTKHLSTTIEYLLNIAIDILE